MTTDPLSSLRSTLVAVEHQIPDCPQEVLDAREAYLSMLVRAIDDARRIYAGKIRHFEYPQWSGIPVCGESAPEDIVTDLVLDTTCPRCLAEIRRVLKTYGRK